MTNKIIGLTLLPFLYMRWSFILIIPIGIYLGMSGEGVFMFWFIWVIFWGFVLGNCEGMIPLSKWLIKVFKVKYKRKLDWTSDMLHSHSVWSHPTVEIKGIDYQFSFASMGGNLYDPDANLRRKILFSWLFNKGKP